MSKLTPHDDKAFTLVELLVTLAVIAVLAGLTFPSLNHARQIAYRSKCLSNMRQISVGFLAYVTDNDGNLPQRVNPEIDRWPRSIRDYLKDTDIYACPADRLNWKRLNQDPLDNVRNYTSYIFNGFSEAGTYGVNNVTIKLVNIPEPSHVILLSESQDNNNFFMDFVEGNESRVVVTNRHLGAAHYVFADGSARVIQSKDYSSDLWKMDKNYQFGKE